MVLIIGTGQTFACLIGQIEHRNMFFFVYIKLIVLTFICTYGIMVLQLRKGEVIMKEKLYVIATRGRNNKEVYLAVDENRENKTNLYKVYFKWTEDINEAYATFTYTDVEQTAKKYFKNYNKWYITDYLATFK